VLTRARIVAEAVAVIEEAGLDGVTMRGLARRLGVDTMSLYNHVDGRDALLDAVAEFVLADVAPPRPTGNLREDVTAIARAFRATATRYPNCAPLVLTRQLGSSAALAPVEAGLSILRTAGFPPERAVHVLRAALAYVVGTLLREVSASPAFSGDDRLGAAHRHAELASSGFAHVAEAAPHLAVCDHHDEFEFGLDLVITALELHRPG
jgi:AcrR family transcriptional regulator